MSNRITYNNTEITLNSEVVLDTLREKIAAALAGKGDPWVPVIAGNGTTHYLLVSPGTHVSIKDSSLRNREQRRALLT